MICLVAYTVMAIITVLILKDTHITVYYNSYSRREIIEDYDLKVLREKYPDSKFEIIVCHSVNIEGLVKLCDNFDHVIVTNSYCDYEYKSNNLTVIDVCEW